jgi:hypothetical protein
LLSGLTCGYASFRSWLEIVLNKPHGIGEAPARGAPARPTTRAATRSHRAGYRHAAASAKTQAATRDWTDWDDLQYWRSRLLTPGPVCPLRARWDEHARVVTVAHGQATKMPRRSPNQQMAGGQRHRSGRLIRPSTWRAARPVPSRSGCFGDLVYVRVPHPLVIVPAGGGTVNLHQRP